jgi:methylated-DNA-[protein]-cysteine S-methyltransferase
MMDRLKELQKLLRRIPQGKVTTYKEIAHAMNTSAYRYVGQLLHRNPNPEKYPCYKVVKSSGELGGYALGQAEKIRRLKADGILVKKGEIVDFSKKLHRF